LPQQEPVLASMLARLQVQLQAVQDEIGRTEQTKILRENDLSAARASHDALERMTQQMAEPGKGGPEQPAETEIEQLEKRLAALRSRYTENHPDVRDTRAALERLKEARQKAAAATPAASEPPSATTGQVAMSGTLIREKERIEQIRGQMVVLDRRLKDLEADKQRILQEISGVQRKISQLPVREQQLAAIARDYEISKANYQSLLDQMESTQRSERFVVLDPARVPEKPIKPDRVTWALTGWAAALLLAFMIGVAYEMNKNVFLGEWELPRELLVLARVPKMQIQSAARRLTAAELMEGAAGRNAATARR